MNVQEPIDTVRTLLPQLLNDLPLRGKQALRELGVQPALASPVAQADA